ncbi:helix-turn-helix domain-containing protein [Arcticibacter tournemirensis]|uniref:AraC family transcriptional regulator n=1 Tax=Arcticibacter tournemirensis TaxID=699437 RepID=A0A4Q0M870_9SPHI|nr:helix-turn-helix domain-containing protein [Arcticibacter tournemirensis]RXF69321.1 AraC family transcriptional regulator [Arcticibacter tournemirensis]
MLLYLGIIALLFTVCTVLIFILTRSRQNTFLLLFLAAIFLHGLAILADTGIPIVLLYGPFIFLALEEYRKRKISPLKLFKHSIPFVFFSLWYFILHTFIVSGLAEEKILVSYYALYFFSMPVSLIAYGVYCLRRRLEKQNAFEVLIDQLSIIEIIEGVLILVMFADFLSLLPELGFNLRWIVLTMLVASAGLILRFLIYSYRKARIKGSEKWQEQVIPPLQERIKAYKGSMPELRLLEAYERQLREYFERSKAFLNPGLTAGMVAAELGMPKHHFSVLLNVYIGRSFYNLVAYYRILYAMELIAGSESSLSIEALANECGFNSKTSFNRYFREFTGFNPSEFKGYLDGPDMEVAI